MREHGSKPGVEKPGAKRTLPPNDDTRSTPEPAAKRPKRLSAHPTLWDAYGNNIVTVQIEDVQFALHSSWLAKHSTFFNRLFGGEDLSDDGARIEEGEGGDVYHISCTTAVDFSALLSAIDNAM
jgi:hypothetical protein